MVAWLLGCLVAWLLLGLVAWVRALACRCYHLTSHLPVFDELCLSSVASIAYYGVDPFTDRTGGTDVYGGPLAGGAYVIGLLNRNHGGNATISAKFSWLAQEGLGDDTSACVRELFSNKTTTATGSVSHWCMIVPCDPMCMT